MHRVRSVLRNALGLCAVCVLLLAASPSESQDTRPPESITVVLDDSYPPYSFRDAEGGLQGILIDEWRLWQQRTGIPVRLIGTTWERAQRLIDHGRADVIDTIFISETRAQRYAFSESHVDIQVPVFFPNDIGGITDVKSLRGFTVGVKEGDPAAEYLRRAGGVTLQEFPTYLDVVRAAAERRIRVFCVDKPPGMYYLNMLNLVGQYRTTQPLYVGELHWAMRKGNWDLLYLVEGGFSRISAREIRGIERRWLGTPVQRLVYYQYGRYVGYAALAAGIVLLGLSLLTWWLRRRVATRTAELQRALDGLRESEARFRLLAESANDVIWTMSLEGRFTYVSPSVEKLRGYTPEEVVAQPLESVVTPAFAPALRSLLEGLARRIRAGERSFSIPAQEVEQPCRDGSTVWTEVIVTPLFDGAGRFLHVLGVSRNISERRRREEAQRALETQMLQAQKLESLGVMAGGIAHDFNNILTTILGNAELAQAELPETSAARPRLRDIDEASRRAADLCRQMLAYSGRGRVVVESLDLSEIVRGMAHMLNVSISKKAVLRASLPPGLPRVTADATQIRQIVMNLIINASEALADGQGTILLSTGVMECCQDYLSQCFPTEKRPPGRYAYVEVMDNGIGMDEKTISRIFDPFFSTKFTGRGLGLAAVLGIVRAHKGAIHLTSAPGRGTKFRVLLPPSGSTASEPGMVQKQCPLWKGSGTVLLVDDEETVLTVGKLMLEKLGFQVITANDGKQAVDVFRRRHAELVCVVLDLTMPRMDGMEAFRELRAIDPRVLVAIATGYSAQEVLVRFDGDEKPAFLQKPYHTAQLASVLQELLSRKTTAEPGR